MGLGKKYTDIDQPIFAKSTSIGGSGMMMLLQGNQIPSPTLNTSLNQATTQVNLTPTINTPSIAWT